MAVSSADAWNEYPLVVITPWSARAEMGRREAKALFERIIGERAYRVEGLRKLLEKFGVNLDFSYASLQSLNDWFIGAASSSPEHPSVPDDRTLSVCEDIALYLGEAMIMRDSSLRWELLTSRKSDPDYQSPAIVGFRNAPGWAHLALSGQVCGYAIGVLEDRMSKIADLDIEVRGKSIALPGESLRFPLKRDYFVGVLERAKEFTSSGYWENPDGE